MPSVVLDASAVLAVLKNEPGRDLVKAHVPDVTVSAVNLAEVVDKLSGSGLNETEVRAFFAILGAEIVPFDERQAYATGMLRPATKHRGLSLGDRACLALARLRKLRVLTADRAWAGLDLGIDVRVIRP